MGLREVLSKMKIVEIEPESAGSGSLSSPAPGTERGIPGPPTDIRELLGSIPPPKEIDEASLAAAAPGAGGPGGEAGGSDEIPDFSAVFSAAGITDPPHGYSAYKVLEILSSPEFANLDSKAKAAALSGFLKMNPTGPVPIAEVVQDAVRRDQALDKFEDFLRTKLKARTEQIEQENRDLQAEIDALAMRNREKMETNRRALAEEEGRFARWQITKRIEERKLFDAVSPFVETNPISTGEAKAPAPVPPPQEPQENEA